MDGLTNGQMDERMDGYTCIDGRMDGCMDEWMDGWVN